MANRSELSMIGKNEEHSFQFCNRNSARTFAKIETQRTGIDHTAFLTTTYRNLTERLCWTVIPVREAKKRNGFV